ncbi:MAG: asparagine synthase (glutamine-hydrolyzing) [Acidimicrobiales bacterium]
MCGIVGYVDRAAVRRDGEAIDLLTRMAARMTPRGPDADGAWVSDDGVIGFGHRRLSIVDLSEHGAQPMESSDGRFVITYNGEIYNHVELAERLRANGVTFRGHSDTEVLIEAFSAWGIDATLDAVDGMFAFGVWDRVERTLTLARDRMGEKPLYYGRLGDGSFVFASSLDVLREHPAFDRPIDRDALGLYFRFKYVPAPWTIYQGISKLGPGCTLRVDEAGVAGEPTAYWSYLDVVNSAEPFTGSDREATDLLEQLLLRSVERRIHADVPVGAFLSGGIDSTTVVAAAQQVSATPVRTFTIGSTNADFDESDDARTIAKHLGTDHTELMVTDADVVATLDRLGEVYDEPFADSSQVPTILVSQLARRDVTVALSGDGGDELFGGYNRYLWVPAIWRRLGSVPLGARRALRPLLASVPPGMWDKAAQALPASRRPRQLGLKIGKVAGVVDAADPEDVFFRLVSHWQDPTSLVRGASSPLVEHTDPARWPRRGDIVDHMMVIDAVTYLPDDVLAKVDRATMSVSLEGRVPLLDRDIVEFAARLPRSMKLRDGTSKWLLREVLHRSVPPRMMDRPKSGFGLPIESWLRGELRGWAEERLFGSTVSEFLATDEIRRRWDAHQSGRANHAYELWDVIMFAEWSATRAISS